ncbi:hypothetical protein NC652_039014 [Populus alba x Populus x berolinensis]|nr:hypothetical protein NC652_039014 [Populus alba x Populus x berolinensis]
MWISIVWCVWLGISFFMDRRVLDDQLLLIGGSIFFLGGCLALYYFQGTSLILLRSWCEIGLAFLREAFPTITLNSSTVNFFPNCSSLEPLCQWWWVLIAGTLRTFYSQLLRSDHLCWGLCFFVFFLLL